MKTPTVGDDIPTDPDGWPECITQGKGEPAPSAFLAVCVGRATEVACSVHCEGTGCGGHPICKPCLDLAVTTGLVTK